MTTIRVSAFTDDAIGSSDATELADKIAKREVSAAEVVEAAIQRAEAVNPAINSIVATCYDAARAQASSVEPGDSALAGVPTFVKDNSELTGLPTRHGSRATSARPAQYTGAYVKQFLSTGVIPLGKSTLPEFGIPPVTESLLTGVSRNPGNTSHTTGGSSGGSAALVAAGVVPIAHANDGGGSTRIPAACCGLVGLKASRDRMVNMDGTNRLPINVVHDGVVTRSVRDTALFMAEAEKHYANPKLPALGHVTGPGRKKLRIGLVSEAIADIALHPDVSRVLSETATLCESLGHHVEQLPIPFSDQLGRDFLDYYSLLFFGITRFGKKIMSPDFDKTQIENFSRGYGGHFMKCLWRFPMVLRRLSRVSEITDGLFAQFDIMLSPTVSAPPPEIGAIIDPSRSTWKNVEAMRDFAPFTALQNITGEPAISLPMGMSSEGLPIGIHFSSQMGADKLLLELAYALEAAGDWANI